DGRVTTLSERTAGLAARPAGDPAALDLLTAGLEATATRVTALEAAVRGGRAPVERMEARVTGLDGRLAAVETEAARLAAAAAAAESARASKPPAEAGWTALGEIRFARGSFALDAASVAQVAAIAGRATAEGRPLVLRGYADRVGDPVYNQALSLRRAIAVQQAL